MKNKKSFLKIRHIRIRKKIHGDSQVPRLVVCRTLNNISGQLIDDVDKKTLFSLSTQNKEVKMRLPKAGNIKAAEFFGEVFAQKAKEKGINRVVFDRAGYAYHGRVKAFAEALRKGGLNF